MREVVGHAFARRGPHSRYAVWPDELRVWRGALLLSTGRPRFGRRLNLQWPFDAGHLEVGMETEEGRETPHIFIVRTRFFSVGLSRRQGLQFRLVLAPVVARNQR